MVVRSAPHSEERGKHMVEGRQLRENGQVERRRCFAEQVAGMPVSKALRDQAQALAIR